MIIQSARLRVTTDVRALAAHVFAGSANRAITVLQGDAGDLGEMLRDAVAAGKRYAIRHFKISPAEATSRPAALGIMRELANEFGFDLKRCVAIKHVKPRALDAGYEVHWHLLAPEFDPVTRRVLDAHWMRPRQEKIARLAELRLGHRQVAGRWNAAVARVLSADGQPDAAAAIAVLTEAPRPECAYTAGRHQAVARRKAPPLPHAKAAVVQAWECSETGVEFERALAARGLRLRPGRRPGIWVIEAPGRGGDSGPVLLGALHRLVRRPAAAVDTRVRTRHPTKPWNSARAPDPFPKPHFNPWLPARLIRPAGKIRPGRLRVSGGDLSSRSVPDPFPEAGDWLGAPEL